MNSSAAPRQGRSPAFSASRRGLWSRPITRTIRAARSWMAPSTMVTDETLLKVYAWYDNEVGYACRMVDLATIVIERSA